MKPTQKPKWLLAGTVILFLYGTGLYALQNWVILPSFTALEDELAQKDLRRCLDAIHREGHHLGKLAGDWAVWDDSYRFVQDGNQEFIDSNLQWETLEKSTGVNLVFICKPDGEIVWGEVYDTDQGGNIPLAEFSKEALNSSHYLIRHDSIDSERIGIMLTEKGPLLIFSRPILKSTGEGPANGVFIMGRFLTPKIIQTLSEQTHVRFSVKDLKTASFSMEERSLLKKIPNESNRILEKDGSLIRAYGMLSDITGQQALLITAQMPRDIMARGKSVGRLASFSVLVTLTFIGLFLAFIFTNYIFGVRRKTAYIEGLIQERTIELKNAMEEADRIRQRAEMANKAKTDFLANMSHELRTPLNGIVGMAEIAGNYSMDAGQRKLIECITSEAGSLLRIINDILDLSKVESGKVELEEIPFDLRAMIHDVDLSMGKQARRKGLTFDTAMPPDIPTRLKGDPGRLRQVLINLIGNAMKFTHAGGITITVDSTTDEGNRLHLKFRIQDTGIGIPKEKQAIIFERFTQADGSTTRRYGGTGLGTTICRQIVQLMGGDIGVESEVGKGTTFWFTVALSLQEAGSEMGFPMDEVLSGLNVLIIDENPVNRALLETLLKSWGSRTVSEADYEKAISLLATGNTPWGTIGLIVTDRRIGDLTGFDLAFRIRAMEQSKDIPIAMLTSVGNLGDGKRCKEAGIRCYLTRPVSEDDLRQALQLLMDCARKGNFESVGGLITKHTIVETFRKTARILLAEDYPVNQQVARMHLDGAGYQVDVAENGRQAVDAFMRNPYDLILMDVQMPVLDGFDATREIRAMESGPDPAETDFKRTPIIAMTAHAVKGYRQSCLEAGMDDYITKPFKRTELLTMVDKWVRPAPADQKKNPTPVETTPTENVSNTSEAPMDFERALKEFMGKRELLMKTLTHFLESGKLQIETIQKALADGNAETVKQEAHKIKGGAANLTANRLARLAHSLESAASGDKLEEASATMKQFIMEFNALENHIAGVRMS